MVPPWPLPPSSRIRLRPNLWLTVLGAVLSAVLATVLGACGNDDTPSHTLVLPTPTSDTPPGAQSSDTPPGAQSPDPDPEPEPEPGPDLAPLAGALRAVPLARHPHDDTAYTQGLEWYQGMLVETTGLEGASSLRLVDPESGRVLHRLELPADVFGEGVTVVDDRALILTWKNQTLFEVPLVDLVAGTVTTLTPAMVQPDAYQGEGWGLCRHQRGLVMSNGTDQLSIRHPDTFEVVDTVAVTLNGQAVGQLNELECRGDQVLANVWRSTSIAVVDLATGRVTATIDASGLVADAGAEGTSSVLNGIAYDHDTNTWWLTGKNWPVMYQVELTPL